MKRITTMLFLSLALVGCDEKTPSSQEAINFAKQEVSLALCGDKKVNCFDSDGESAKIGPRRNDKTNQIIVAFRTIKPKVLSEGKLSDLGGIEAGIVTYNFDATNGKTYIKDISLWSIDGKHSVELCGHDYKFCRE